MSIKSKFCAKCGRVAVLVDGICTDCRLGESAIDVPKNATLRICKSCGAVDFEGLWIQPLSSREKCYGIFLGAENPLGFSRVAKESGSMKPVKKGGGFYEPAKSQNSENEFFENLLIKRVKLPENAELEEIKIVEKENTSARVSVTVSMAGQPFTQVFPIHLETKRTICPECSMHRRKQYVAVIQLRDVPANVEKMMRMASKFKTYILKFEELRTGVDIYFTSKEAGKHLASELRKRFKLKTTLSSEAYSWDNSKNRPKYKLTILMRARE